MASLAVRRWRAGVFAIKLGALGVQAGTDSRRSAGGDGSRSAAFAVLLSPSAPKFLASSTQDLYSPYT